MSEKSYQLVISFPATPRDPDGVRRLRWFLKAMKRQFGIRCREVKEAQSTPKEGRDVP